MILATPDDQCLRMKREFRFFHFLDEQDVSLLSPYFECRKLQQGDNLWLEGDRSSFVAFIVDGRIETKKETEFRGKQVVVGVYSHESLIGIVSILSNEPRPVTATALEESHLLLLHKAKFDEINQNYPELGGKLMKGMLFCLSMRLRQSYERLASIF
ncbi:Crp/Fnr family transcriptional regulator [Desulfuromonas acetoxidans]|uniref:Cyclic nucleotide-binding protein n=1 Tax=Desulfuromonas acetoxidans (strain DSM 684 / 11070) TaxID=281689 RepID=Q1K4A2_DESA6|nr:cyclic nucleotide-binding domain-containing protein [Desulfuromonas acetoxidans]EAT17201.1 cyclic nucleotide-binding protein [Desulfuromonas acetoxidans DSM 684]MBF0645404.1 cyclic nucleotide-binding domain-containing protein [Desulfuromonas acetoxidans]NVD24210.1 cyclic nucleotide-binding domain-containing protein [Desulfuromonas acetoxidans]NVE15017.1 cyclic nucleotide-binding domain-containing protein [Desulfuromonas acetoxidans]